ncbi:hypothetical protein chiPu_0000621 [Chiloscyllium punctatum]|uniref:Uncharacterized protein n=1 Tax=Chiloscyllium punctatum TaxID=137246 RepID=A0A401RVT6_CHIPU|nr:hypothetical protein [Chiloscyllium punctatum]
MGLVNGPGYGGEVGKYKEARAASYPDSAATLSPVRSTRCQRPPHRPCCRSLAGASSPNPGLSAIGATPAFSLNRASAPSGLARNTNRDDLSHRFFPTRCRSLLCRPIPQPLPQLQLPGPASDTTTNTT